MKFLSTAMAFIFFLQTMAWASGQESIESKWLLQHFVKQFNSLSRENKANEILRMLGTRHINDQDFIKVNLGDLHKVNYPHLTYADGEILFTVSDQKVILKQFNEASVNVNGVAINFASGKFPEAGMKLKSIFTDKKVTRTNNILDFFLSEAHADENDWKLVGGIAAILIGIVAIIAALGMTIVSGGTFWLFFGGILSTFGGIVALTEDDLNHFCNKTRETIANLDTNSTLTQIQELKESISDNENKLKDSSECLKKVTMCEKVRECLNSLDESINHLVQSVNQTGRDESKKINSSIKKSPSVINQGSGRQ